MGKWTPSHKYGDLKTGEKKVENLKEWNEKWL